MVVLILPTLANNASLAKSVPNSGVSSIFSLKTLDERGERTNVLMYRSWKVVFVPAGSPRKVGLGSVKTACWSEKMWCRRSYWRSLRVMGSPSQRLTQYGAAFLCATCGLGRRDILRGTSNAAQQAHTRRRSHDRSFRPATPLQSGDSERPHCSANDLHRLMACAGC